MDGRRRRVELRVEGLEARLVLSAAIPTTGPYVAPAAIRPRIREAPLAVDPHEALNRYLTALLGQSDLDRIRNIAEARDAVSRAVIFQRIYQQPFIRGLLTTPDTYALLNSPAMQQLVGFTQLSTLPAAPETVQYVLEASRVAIGAEATTVQVPPDGSGDGFVATVPNANVRELQDGSYSVDIPIDQIPVDAPAPESATVLTGTLSPTYRQTGPILTDALLTGRKQRGPNIPAVVRGLRLPRALNGSRAFPANLQPRYVRLFRVALERNAFTPTASQTTAIQDQVSTFFQEVADLQQQGTFEPPVPPATPTQQTAKTPLAGTLAVTSGALRDLINVAPDQTGLPLLGLNFPGRVDAGYVIAPNGDYGLILKVTGPLLGAPAGYAPTDLVGGDVRFEVSNATTLTDLNGQRVEEGLDVGTALMGTLSSSRKNAGTGSGTLDLNTFSGSLGYGTGLSFGTAVSYTRVIPLGNLNALIPQSPA